MLRALSLALALVTAGAAAPPADAPTDKTVIDLCGRRMSKVFARFGMPENVYSAPLPNGREAVMIDYGTYSFKVREKNVLVCFFWTGWKEPIHGFKIGDGRASLVKLLGDKYVVEKQADGIETYGWSLDEPEATLFAIFDKDDKVASVQVILK